MKRFLNLMTAFALLYMTIVPAYAEPSVTEPVIIEKVIYESFNSYTQAEATLTGNAAGNALLPQSPNAWRTSGAQFNYWPGSSPRVAGVPTPGDEGTENRSMKVTITGGLQQIQLYAQPSQQPLSNSAGQLDKAVIQARLMMDQKVDTAIQIFSSTTNQFYPIIFCGDGTIRKVSASGAILGNWTANEWYTVKIVIDAGARKYDVYAYRNDGTNAAADENLDYPADQSFTRMNIRYNHASITLESPETSVLYIDDLKMVKSASPLAAPECKVYEEGTEVDKNSAPYRFPKLEAKFETAMDEASMTTESVKVFQAGNPEVQMDYMGELSADGLTYTLEIYTELSPNTIYNLTFSDAVKASNWRSFDIGITTTFEFKTKRAVTELTETTFVSGGTVTKENLVPGAEASFNALVTNNSGETLDVVMIVVFFKEDKLMTSIGTDFADEISNGADVHMSAGFTVPNDYSAHGYTVEVYVWDSFELQNELYHEVL